MHFLCLSIHVVSLHLDSCITKFKVKEITASNKNAYICHVRLKSKPMLLILDSMFCQGHFKSALSCFFVLHKKLNEINAQAFYYVYQLF